MNFIIALLFIGGFMLMGWELLKVLFIIFCGLLGFFKQEDGYYLWNPWSALTLWAIFITIYLVGTSV